ncbi:MAG: hypothetical protein AAF630_20820 [Cyanobacteria bacterium P01_C01_bin.38]
MGFATPSGVENGARCQIVRFIGLLLLDGEQRIAEVPAVRSDCRRVVATGVPL